MGRSETGVLVGSTVDAWGMKRCGVGGIGVLVKRSALLSEPGGDKTYKGDRTQKGGSQGGGKSHCSNEICEHYRTNQDLLIEGMLTGTGLA